MAPRNKNKAEALAAPAQDDMAARAETPSARSGGDALARLEELGTDAGNGQAIAALYRQVAGDPVLASAVARRALEILDNWGEDPSAVLELLELISDTLPGETWALDRLKLSYSSEGRWADLLRVLDRAIEAADHDATRVSLIEDAGRVAKDFARDLERATHYSEKLFAIRGDERSRAALEKLYERCGRHDALVDLYAAQIPGAVSELAQALRAKIATLLLSLDDSDGAFGRIEEMLAVDPEHGPAFDLLERIFAAPTRSIPPPAASPDSTREPATTAAPPAARSIRQRAALLLKPRYVAAGRSRELVRVLQVELAVATSDEARARTYRELAALQLDALRDDIGALDALAALVVLEPAEMSHRRALKAVAQRLGKEERQVKMLCTAADRSTVPSVRASLLLEAAEVCRDTLGAPARAIDLYQRVLASSDLDPATLLLAARSASPLLESMGRAAERCEVLERLAELETDAQARKAALGEVARIASHDFGDKERAIRAWRARLGDDAADLDAVAGMRSALTEQGRFRELLSVLENAAHASTPLRAELLWEAAGISERELGDGATGIRLYQELLAHTPADTAVMEKLSQLYREQSMRPELLALRRRQLELTSDVREKVRLRLDIAGALEQTGAVDEQIATLQANLADDPREPASVERLSAVYAALERFEPLVILWEGLAALATPAEAAPLWRCAAELAESRLGDGERAVRDYERAGDDRASLDALTRLYRARGDHLAGASALERLIELCEPAKHPELLLRLSEAYVAGERRESARRRLEEATKTISDGRLRGMLADIYRADGAWAELALLLTEEATNASDDVTRASLLCEAAALHLEKRATPEAAIPLLERALEISDSPNSVALTLAPALAAVGRVADAVVLLRARVEAYGARRPKERALVHHALARALLLTNERTAALAELELAVKIDPVNLQIRRALADTAAASGDLETAQNMYRAMLLVLPREPKSGELTRAELFVCLADVAERRADATEASECLESALSAARENDVERAAAERELWARGRHAVLAELLRERVELSEAVEERALACDQLSELYASDLGRPDDALAMALRAVSLTPVSLARNQRALALAKSSGRTDAYLQLVTEQCERATSAEAVHDVHVLLGAALEAEERLDEAARAYERAERAALELEPHDVGGRRLDQVWKALDRVYSRLRDDEARAPVLERRAAASQARGEPASERAETLYALANIRLARSKTRSIGFDVLEQALAANRQPERAEAAILTTLAADPDDERALLLYESISRTPGRERSLIDALDRLGALPASRGALREAAGIAVRIGDPAVAEQLLRRYLELVADAGRRSSVPLVGAPGSPTRRSRETNADLGGALLALATLRGKANDAREAASLKERAAARFDAALARPILLEVATAYAGPLADLPQAARVYGALFANGPLDRAVWQPLLEIHRTLGDVGQLSGLVDDVAAQLDDPAERARLRLVQATVLIAASQAKPSRRPSADTLDDDWGVVSASIWPGATVRPPRAGASVKPSAPTSVKPPTGSHDEMAARALWQALDDEPSSVEAVAMLSSLLERTERLDELAKLLARLLEAEKDRANAEGASSLAARLGVVLEQSGREEEAVDAYRVAADWDPKNRTAARALMRLSEKRQEPADIAEATEALLALETGPEAERLALRLAALRTTLDDKSGAERALEDGLARYPESATLRSRLVDSYTAAGAWRKLADYHVAASDTRQSADERVEELRAAAQVLRAQLDDAQGAADVLERGLAIEPNDRGLLLSLVNAWSSAGAHERAIRAIDGALAASPSDEEALLHMRAVLHIASGALEPALVDLERAFMLSGGSYAEELATLLEQVVESGEGDTAAHRVRLAEILVNLEQPEEACAHLQAVVAAEPTHREALTTLAALHADAGRADESIDCYSALLALLDGDALVDATLAFADLCDAHGRLATLRPALERASKVATATAELKQRLRSTYASLGENRELANLLLEDAHAEADPGLRFALLTDAARILVDPKSGDPKRAMAVLAEARQIKADDPETVTLLADALTASGKSGEALELLEQLLVGQKRRSKSRSGIHRRVAHLYLAMGARSTALQSLVKAMEDDPHDAELAMEVGDMAVEQNDFDAMPRAFRTVTLMKTAPAGSGARPTPEDKAVAYYHLARVAHLQGDPKKARLLADKSLSEAPTAEARALREALKT